MTAFYSYLKTAQEGKLLPISIPIISPDGETGLATQGISLADKVTAQKLAYSSDWRERALVIIYGIKALEQALERTSDVRHRIRS